ncbi:MAG: nucleoside-diphosphate kinase [Candidatus Xiphinematobacter sp.]|nr:MAG: nucleoside-diphosphate kinase [Candidatus Xiphinematobacter sp.]
MEITLVLLKPDCLLKRHVGDILSRFEESGFRICGIKMLQLNARILRKHYAHIADKPFFREVQSFMESTPVIALALAGKDVVARARELAGPTDSLKAMKGTIRGDFGQDVMINAVHTSDSSKQAESELKYFFQREEIFEYALPVAP